MGHPLLQAIFAITLALAADPAPSLGSSHRANLALDRGVFLIATHQVTGYFAETVLLLLDYDPRGAYGVIINRPSVIPLAQLLPGGQAPPGRSDRLFSGGPVGIDSLAVLVRGEVPPERSTPILADLHVSAGTAALRRALDEDVPTHRLRAYLGHAGWAPGQLDAEVARGDWRVVESIPDLVFDTAPEKIWPQLIFEHGGIQARTLAPLLHPRCARIGSARPDRRRTAAGGSANSRLAAR